MEEMLKTVLCYDDSNIWGYHAVTGGRFGCYERQRSVLQQELGTAY